jgi:selenide,water dikinase
MAAGLVDRVQVTLFPVITGQTGLDPIFQGGADKVREANGIIAGGHTVTDPEPKYGLCVTGFADPAQIMSKGGARPGDRLFLTKPIGTGVITTAAKNDRATPAHLQAAVDSMLKLNGPASRVFQWAGVRSCTDITGFGLLGHASEMAQASRTLFRIDASAVPLLDGALDCVKDKQIPGGTGRNRDYLLNPEALATHNPAQEPTARVRIKAAISRDLQTLLFDPQTSGGLLAAISPDRAAQVRAALHDQGVECWEIGEVAEGLGVTVS